MAELWTRPCRALRQRSWSSAILSAESIVYQGSPSGCTVIPNGSLP